MKKADIRRRHLKPGELQKPLERAAPQGRGQQGHWQVLSGLWGHLSPRKKRDTQLLSYLQWLLSTRSVSPLIYFNLLWAGPHAADFLLMAEDVAMLSSTDPTSPRLHSCRSSGGKHFLKVFLLSSWLNPTALEKNNAAGIIGSFGSPEILQAAFLMRCSQQSFVEVRI